VGYIVGKEVVRKYNGPSNDNQLISLLVIPPGIEPGLPA